MEGRRDRGKFKVPAELTVEQVRAFCKDCMLEMKPRDPDEPKICECQKCGTTVDFHGAVTVAVQTRAKGLRVL